MINSKSEIAILMATYNGEKYLGEQIDSILAQTYHDWHLYIHDDGSKDGTLSIIQEYVLNHPDKITLLDYPSQGGACKNFLSLLERVEAPYYMFCDQDDVWLPEKIEKKYAKIRELEKENHHTPIVVYSDLIVTDSNLNTISPSLWNIAGIYPEFVKSFDEMAANTLMSGCAMLFNHDAKITVPPIKENITMHDAWIACCVAKQNGILYPIKQPTIFYRQHSANALGAQDVRNPTLIKRIRRFSTSYKRNKEHYLMLRNLSYGSIFKYIRYKLAYRVKIKGMSK
jgi:glycosyltransferase involved in cell wall biosynthesis